MEISDNQTQVDVPPVLTRVSELVDARPEAFIVGDEETRAATLQAAKYAFDLCKLHFALAHCCPTRHSNLLSCMAHGNLISRAARTARPASCSPTGTVC